MFFLFFYGFVSSFNKDDKYIIDILRTDLIKRKQYFTSLDDITAVTHENISLFLPSEFNRVNGLVDHIKIVSRTVSWYENMGENLPSMSRSYTKMMIDFICSGRNYVFEFKVNGVFNYYSNEIPPFIAISDVVELFWYDGMYETKMSSPHNDDYDEALPIICLYNRTSNTLFYSRCDITPQKKFEVVGTGMREVYKSYPPF